MNIVTEYFELKEKLDKLGWNGQKFLARVKNDDMYQNYLHDDIECMNDYISLVSLGFNVDVRTPKHEGFMLLNEKYLQLVIK